MRGAGCSGAYVLLSAWKATGYEEVGRSAKAAAKSWTHCHCNPASSTDSYQADWKDCKAGAMPA